MKMMLMSAGILGLLAAAVLAQPGGPTPATLGAYNPASPLPEGAKATKISGGFRFTEGATADKDGDVYFIDQPNDRIMKWSWSRETPEDLTKGKVEVFLHPSGYSNGMCFDNDGNLIACADEKNELWSIAAPFPALPSAATQPQGFKPADLKITVLIKDNGGKPMNGPNDVWVVPKGPLAGAMYLTDPLYARDWWKERPGGKGMQQAGKYVYFFSADHKTLTPVVTDFNTPNGIIGTPDGKMLYVSDIAGRQTWSYTIKEDGTLGDKKLFCAAGSDGMTIDSEGNVYTTAGNAREGLQIWNKEGKLVGRVPIGCANCCIGGKEKDILFINSAADVWGIKLKTKGVGPQ